jgi:arylsulfatase A-like enzyme/Tfp pilus assembly protein PilF
MDISDMENGRSVSHQPFTDIHQPFTDIHQPFTDIHQPSAISHQPLATVRTAALLAVALSVSCAAPSRSDLRAIAGQNVLLITIDTLRADALGCYGGPAATPALDRLAAGGIRFDFAHAHAVTTLASHASILTGTYPFQHGIRDNSGYRLAPRSQTAAARLKGAGYATAAFVGAFPVHSRFGLNQGFDVYDDRFGDAAAPAEFMMPERPAAAVVALARSWIGGRAGGSGGLPSPRDQGRPWFVWIHVFDPHAPYRPPPPFDSQYASQPYYGEVAAVDAALAPLLDEVRALSRPTLVVVTGDHGEALGDHGEQSHGLFAYESTLRIPLIIAELSPDRPQNMQSSQRMPQSIVGAIAALSAGSAFAAERGDVSTTPARHVDILPTILAAVGLPSQDLPGRSLLTSADRADATPRPSYFEAMSAMLNRGWAPLSGVIVDRGKYIDLPIAERYDLAADAAERTNLAGKSPDRDRALAGALRGFAAAAPGARQAEDGEAAARLRALGYVSGTAAPKARYTEADDPKSLVEIDRQVHDAVDAFTAGRGEDAARLYERVIAHRPDMAIAYRHLAFVEWQRGDAKQAIDVLRRGVKAGVTDPRLVAQLGGYLTETGRMREGISLLESVTNGESSDLDALNALGIAYAQSGRTDAARSIFERVLTINPSSSVPLENLGLLALDRGDIVEARRNFERAANTNPRSSRAHAGLGNVALKAGDSRMAVDQWKRAVALDPRNFDALYNVGTTLAREGDRDGARPYLEQFLRTAPPALYQKDLRAVAQMLGR